MHIQISPIALIHISAVDPGERGVLPILAASTQQAGQTYNFVKGVFTESKRFAALVDNISSDAISLKNRIDIQIRSASFRTLRGITAVAAIAEELSMWQRRFQKSRPGNPCGSQTYSGDDAGHAVLHRLPAC